MKVLLVTHDFLPRNRAGVEICAFWLARNLEQEGHEVRIFTTEKAMAFPDGALREIAVEGIKVHQMVRNRMFRNFRETWDFPPAESAFRRVLTEWQPQVVHFHHLMYLSLNLPRIAREVGCATAMTLHDYWLQCRFMGQRRDPWGRICFELAEEQCARCLAAQPPEVAGPGKHIAAFLLRGLRALTGIDLGPWARGRALRQQARNQARSGGEEHPLPAEPAPASLPPYKQELAERRQAVLTRVVPNIEMFRAPSRFLRDELVRWGIPEERIQYHPLGIETTPVPRTPRSGPVRFAFLGTVAPHKGVHVLLEAFRGLADRAELVIHGGATYHAAYGEEVRALCSQVGARWTGAYRPDEFGELLGRCDCLVVPSVWFENSPLTILQARQAGIPSVVTDLGGMAELVAGGVGWTFPSGDVAGLHELLTRLAANPEMLQARADDFSAPPTAADDARGHVEFYKQLLAGRES